MLRRYIDGWQVAVARDVAGLSSLIHPASGETLGAVVHVVPDDVPGDASRLPRLPPDVAVITCSLAKRRDVASEIPVFAYLEKPILSDQIAAVLKRLRPVRDVLLVDDDPEMIRLLARMVRATLRRARIRGACGGDEALQELQTCRPDVLFLDLLMPGIDGEAILARLRADARLRDLPVVVVSARERDHATPAAVNIGIARADEFSLTELTRCVQGCLNALGFPDRSSGRELRGASAG
jgi:CheY-like chemotaxis protein